MQQLDFIILGGGASGLQLAYRLSNHNAFSNASILILESSIHKGNDRTWCYWETGDGEWDDLLQNQWNKVQFKSKNVNKTINLGNTSYKMLRDRKEGICSKGSRVLMFSWTLRRNTLWESIATLGEQPVNRPMRMEIDPIKINWYFLFLFKDIIFAP